MPTWPTGWRTSPRPIWSCASGRTSCSSIPSSGSASSHSGSASMRLVKQGRVVEDRFVRWLDDAPVPEGVAVIVPHVRLWAEPDLLRRSAPTGVIWPNDRKVAELADRKSTRLNSSHLGISYAVFCLKKKNNNIDTT